MAAVLGPHAVRRVHQIDHDRREESSPRPVSYSLPTLIPLPLVSWRHDTLVAEIGFGVCDGMSTSILRVGRGIGFRLFSFAAIVAAVRAVHRERRP